MAEDQGTDPVLSKIDPEKRQFIGKLMRGIDVAPVRHAIDQHRTRQRSGGARFHQIEDWRDRLVREGAPALPALQAVAPDADPILLRELMAAIERAQDDQSRRTASRALFRYLETKWKMGTDLFSDPFSSTRK